MHLPKWWNQKWDWLHPHRHMHGIFSDLSVLKSINTGSDHRIVWRRAQINTRLERAKLTMQPKKIDTNKLKKHQVKFEAELWNRFSMLDDIPHDDLNATADTITKVMYETTLLVAGQHQGEKPDKLSTRTKMLMEKRRVMKRSGTTWDNLEYIQTCKAIRQGMKDDILAFNEKQVLEAIEKNKKHARHKQCIGKKQLISIMEEDDTQIHNRDLIVRCCVEFYQELYRSRRLQTNTIELSSHIDHQWMMHHLPSCLQKLRLW